MPRNRTHLLWLGLCLMLLAPCARVAPPADLPDVASGPALENSDIHEVLLTRLGRQPALTEEERRSVARVILEEATRHRISPHLVLAVIHIESAYQPFAISHAGALGLMQVMPPTGAEVADRIGIAWRGRQTLFDPETNVRIGVAYLRELLDRYGDVRTALAAYNWGPGRVDKRVRRGRRPPAQYADQVMGAVPQQR